MDLNPLILSGGDATTRGSSPAVGPSGISTGLVPSAARVIDPAAKAELQQAVALGDGCRDVL